MTPAEKSLCDIIRGDITSWHSSEDASWEQLAEAAFHHNIHLILFDTLKRSSTWSRWPTRLREMLEKAAAAAAGVDLIREHELRSVLNCLDRHGIQPILLKGVPLAYTLYQSPALRPRSDTDLLVREMDLKTVARILRHIGYSGPDIQTDKLTSYQCTYIRQAPFGVSHTLDVHWRANNAQLFAKTFTFDELLTNAAKIPSLAPCALGLSHEYALLLACIHRFGHAHAPFYVDGRVVYAGDELRWVYDIHLLCLAFNATLWVEFTTLARAKRVAAFCLDSLNTAREAFHTDIPTDAISTLQTAARTEAVNVGKLKDSAVAWFLANLQALPTLRRRLTLIKQVAFPPSAYMMEKYKTNNWLALPFLYGYRTVNGVSRTMRQRTSQQQVKRTFAKDR